jgi:hypothetical protein
MATIRPPVAVAFRLSQTDLERHLAQVELLAVSWEWTDHDVHTARQLTWGLVAILQRLLRKHGLQANGEYLICPSGWPCPVVTTIHAPVKDFERCGRRISSLWKHRRTRPADRTGATGHGIVGEAQELSQLVRRFAWLAHWVRLAPRTSVWCSTAGRLARPQLTRPGSPRAIALAPLTDRQRDPRARGQ